MSGFIPEITTTVTVNVNTERLDEAINVLGTDNTGCLNNLGSLLQSKQETLKQSADPISQEISKNLQSHQEQIIGARHRRTGMMANSVDITHDGDGTYLVGNTAMSVDGFPYPLAIETGRREVYPINVKYLRWWDESGNIVFSKYSKAVSADPYVVPSIEASKSDLEGIINNYLKSVL